MILIVLKSYDEHLKNLLKSIDRMMFANRI